MQRQPVKSACGGLYCALRAQLYPYRGYIDRVRGRLYFTATVGGDITCRRQISPEHREDLTHAIGVDITARHSGRFPYTPSDATASGYIRLRRVILCPSAQLYPYRGYIDRVRGRLYFTAAVGGDITCRRQISPEHREDLTHAIGVDITARHSGRLLYCPSDATATC